MTDEEKVVEENIPTEEKQTTENAAEEAPKQENQWDAVAKDFQALGETIATAIKSVWTNESTQSQVSDLKTGLQNMADQVGHAIDEAKETVTSDEVKGEFKKATTEVKDFGGKVYSESKPFFLDVLKSINESIESMIEKLEPDTDQNTEATPKQESAVEEPIDANIDIDATD